MPRIGVVGTGWWAIEHHIPGLLGYDGAELVALADPNATKLRQVAEKFGVARTYPDASELFASGDLDGVVIATPHATHYGLARDALDAGLHVFVEKPMVLRAADAWDLVERADRGGRHLTVGYTYHYTRAAQRLRDVLAAGDLGELLSVAGTFMSMVESYYRGRPADYADAFAFALTGPDPQTYSDPAVAGGGQAMTQVTHPMGLVLYMTGRAPRRVSAFMASADLSVDLVDAIAYELDGGVVGTMASAGTIKPGQEQQEDLRFFGTRGHAVIDLVTGQLRVVRDGEGVEEVGPGPGESAYPAEAPARGFADLVAGRAGNLAPPVPAARTVEFLEACYASAATGTVVTTSGR